MVDIPPWKREAGTRRVDDVAWREKVRTEDLAWREKVRAEDLAWREKVRTLDRAERDALVSQNKQCLTRGLALIAAAQIAKPGTPAEELIRMALDFTSWIGEAAGTPNEGTGNHPLPPVKKKAT